MDKELQSEERQLAADQRYMFEVLQMVKGLQDDLKVLPEKAREQIHEKLGEALLETLDVALAAALGTVLLGPEIFPKHG